MRVYSEIRTDGAERRRLLIGSLFGALAGAIASSWLISQALAWLS